MQVAQLFLKDVVSVLAWFIWQMAITAFKLGEEQEIMTPKEKNSESAFGTETFTHTNQKINK